MKPPRREPREGVDAAGGTPIHNAAADSVVCFGQIVQLSYKGCPLILTVCNRFEFDDGKTGLKRVRDTFFQH
jgi:hypothetical protein